MKRFSRSLLSPFAFAALLCGGAFPLGAGVENFLSDLDFSEYQSKPALKSAPAVPASPHTPPDAVPSGSGLITKEDIEARIQLALSRRFGLRGDFQVEVTQWESAQIQGNWSLQLLQCSPDRPSSSAFVRFVVVTAAGKSSPVNVAIRCRHVQEIYIAGRALSRGDRIAADSLEKRKVDVFRQNVRVITGETDLEGYELMASVSPGSPVLWNHVNAIPLIRKGQVVDVFGKGRGIYITMKGLAMQDGGSGEYIKIRNVSSKQEFQAKVLNENSVKVFF
jgi:flagella basal body P-ring formation protein FlgA